MEKLGEKQETRERKHSIATLPSLSVLAARREIPIKNNTHTTTVPNSHDWHISDDRGQDLKLATLSTI